MSMKSAVLLVAGLAGLTGPLGAMPTEWTQSLVENRSRHAVKLEYLGSSGSWKEILVAEAADPDLRWKALSRRAPAMTLKAGTRYRLRIDQDDSSIDLTFALATPSVRTLFHIRKAPSRPQSILVTASPAARDLSEAPVAVNLKGFRNPDGGNFITIEN
jgi:hypothetical protein